MNRSRISDSGVARTGLVLGAVAVVAAAVVVVVLVGGRDETSVAFQGAEVAGTAPSAGAEPVEQVPGSADEDLAPAASVGGMPTLLDLGDDKCVPCKMMAPILDELRETYEGELSVVFIDVWKDRDAAREYGIATIPTQIFLDAEGTELFRHQGYYSREDILAKWKELGYTFAE